MNPLDLQHAFAFGLRKQADDLNQVANLIGSEILDIQNTASPEDLVVRLFEALFRASKAVVMVRDQAEAAAGHAEQLLVIRAQHERGGGNEKVN